MTTIAASGKQPLPRPESASPAAGPLWARFLADWLGGLGARNELSDLDDRMLRDIGVTREVSCGQLRFEAERRLWLP